LLPMDIVGVTYVVSSSSTRGMVLSTGDVRRTFDMVQPDAPASPGVAIELSVDHREDRKIGQACPEARPEGIPLARLGPPKEVPCKTKGMWVHWIPPVEDVCSSMPTLVTVARGIARQRGICNVMSHAIGDRLARQGVEEDTGCAAT